MRQINWNAIYGFWLVAEHGSFAAAAKELPYGSVQALHKRVRQLESEENLNLKLFRSRGVKGVQLTEAGQSLHDLVDPVFKPFELFAAELRGEDLGSLVATVSSYAAYHYIPDILQVFHREFPKVSVKLQTCEPLEAAMMMERGHADVALCSPWKSSHAVAVKAKAPIRLMIVAPTSCFTGDDPATWSDILEIPFILLNRSSVTRQLFEDFLRSANLLPKLRVAAEVSNSDLAVAAVRAGFGISLMPLGPRTTTALNGLRKIAPPPGLAQIDLAVMHRGHVYMPRYMGAFLEIAAKAISAQ